MNLTVKSSRLASLVRYGTFASDSMTLASRSNLGQDGGMFSNRGGSSPSLRPDLSLSTPSHYALSTIVFISKTIRHPLNQLDLVVESFRYTVAVTIPDIVDNRLKPTRQRPGQPFQWLLRACARALNQLQERLTGWLFILALEPQPQVLNPVDHLAQLRKAKAPLVTRD